MIGKDGTTPAKGTVENGMYNMLIYPTQDRLDAKAYQAGVSNNNDINPIFGMLGQVTETSRI